jgi:hypothetical protein
MSEKDVKGAAEASPAAGSARLTSRVEGKADEMAEDDRNAWMFEAYIDLLLTNEKFNYMPWLSTQTDLMEMFRASDKVPEIFGMPFANLCFMDAVSLLCGTGCAYVDQFTGLLLHVCYLGTGFPNTIAAHSGCHFSRVVVEHLQVSIPACLLTQSSYPAKNSGETSLTVFQFGADQVIGQAPVSTLQVENHFTAGI